jgi:hypothetical protein
VITYLDKLLVLIGGNINQIEPNKKNNISKGLQLKPFEKVKRGIVQNIYENV